VLVDPLGTINPILARENAVTVLDANRVEVSGQRVRRIGIDAPDGNQPCEADGRNWPCGQVATAAF